MISRERVRHELKRRELTVSRTREVVPGMIRVTLTGSDLDGFVSLGPADHVKVFFPDGDSVVGRDYTPLEFREGDGTDPELDIDFVIHGAGGVGGGVGAGSGVVGPAAIWAANAKPGDTIAIGGPRGSHLPPEGATEAIIIADESALPSARRWLEVFDGKVQVTGMFWVENPATEDYFGDLKTTTNLRWFTGEGRERELESALRACTISETTFVFLAGEATTLVPLRRYLRRELELPAIQVDAHGYWKRGESGHDHHAPLDPADPD